MDTYDIKSLQFMNEAPKTNGLIININSKINNLTPFYVALKDNKIYIFIYQKNALQLLCEFKQNKIP